ncbi:unnamed protein product [Cochlearia groenlandica]
MVKESKASSLKTEQKVLLHRSIAQYLDRSGFSKSFKKLLFEAEIEKNELKDTTLPDLEDIYCEYLKKSQVEAVELKDESRDDEKNKKKKEEVNVDENASDDNETLQKNKKEEVAVNAVEGVDKAKKEKKKKKKEQKWEVAEEEEEKVKETPAEIEDSLKEKKKKKKKKEPKVEVTEEEEEKVKETPVEVEDVPKEKKKKKSKSKSSEAEPVVDEDDVVKEKISKKRKRSEPEDTKEQTEEIDESSKRVKKGDNVEEADDDMGVEETPVKQTSVEENVDAVKSETKSTNQKSGKGLSNSKEPKKPFQRVNVDDIVFTDDRLKDNSYWAKDGADSGYGAKAQEVLGQVRGRGFRHEKTKKKRGSYRGGEIDLESHSVKFDYSDEE